MKKILMLIPLLVLALLTWAQEIRKPVVAGMFYEENPEALSRTIDRFLQRASSVEAPPENILALISPHAGYVYSGQVAACAYSLVKGKNYRTVVIIGPSHRYAFRGCSIYPKGGYETPLGVAEIDEALAEELSRASGFKYIPQAHQNEHSVEVQVPFIQKILPQARIVPVVMGAPTRKTITTLARALAEVLAGKEALVIASTDMSHFLTKKEANELDSRTISLIKAMDTDSLLRQIERGEGILCGGGPVVSTLLYAQHAAQAEVQVLGYADSSQAGGPESQVVGYLAAAVYSREPEVPLSLTPEEKKELLSLARDAIQTFLTEKKVVAYRTDAATFLTKRGAFVTLKKKGLLRGCIGYAEPVLPLYETVIRAAILSASKDTRFPPVRAEELDDIEIEISVLSLPRRIENPRMVQVGKHGLIIARDDKAGLLLPHVPVENGWSREEFLRQGCLKAGLPPDAWKSGAEISIFEAIVFHEEASFFRDSE